MEERSGERGDRLGVKTRRRGALTRAEAVKRGRAAMGRGALGHGTLRTWLIRMAVRQARHREGGVRQRGGGFGHWPVGTGLYPCPRHRAAPPHSANRSKALRDTADDKWAPCVSDFPN
jgi:hypothetical protein